MVFPRVLQYKQSKSKEKKCHNINRSSLGHCLMCKAAVLEQEMAAKRDLHTNHTTLWMQRIFIQGFRDTWFKCVSAIWPLLSRLAVSVYESWHRRSIAQPCISECVLMCLDIKDERAFRSLVRPWGSVDVNQAPERLYRQLVHVCLQFAQWRVCVC